MSEQVNSLNIPSIQPKRKITFRGATQPVMQGNTAASLPATSGQAAVGMQGTGANIQQTMGETQLGNRVKNSSEMGQSPYTLPVTLATWYAIAQGMDKFGEKCGGDYANSVLGKITGRADKISDAVTGSKIAKSGFGKGISKMFGGIKNYLDRITSNPKNRILYALRNTHTRPECKLVIGPAAGVNGFFVMDTTKTVFDEFLKPAHQAIQLKQYGKDEAYIKQFLESVKGLSKKDKLLKLQQEELKYFGVKAGDIAGKSADDVAKLLRELKITKGLGFKDVAQYEKFLNEAYTLNHMKDLKNILRNGDQKLKVLIWKKDGALGKLTSHLFGRELSIAELANKTELLTTGAKTKFGKFVGKAFAYLTEGCTNRFAGGKLAVLMQAFIFADMFIHTAKAPKGEKGKTLAERFVNDFTYFLALPLGVGLMHMAGGLKYAGMTKQQVEAYRQNLKLFNANHASYGKKMFKMRKKVLDRQLMAGVKNPFVKLLKKAANLLTVGIERTKTYVSKDKLNLNWLRKSKYFGKNALGYIIRFAIPMFMLSPLFAKWTTKATHKIFGRPTNSVLDEDKEPETTENAANANTQQKPQQAQTAAAVNNPAASQTFTHRKPEEYKSDTNLIKMAAAGQRPTQSATLPTQTVAQTPAPVTAAPAPATTTTPNHPAQNNNDPNKEPEPVRTYIPSPEGVVLKGPDMTPLEQALANADKVEQQGYAVLKSI